jgi:hypothetical protein
VFDGSTITSSGLSLNEVLHVGPPVQQGLFASVVHLRNHHITYIAEHRRVNVGASYFRLQQNLWHISAADHPRAYENLADVISRCLQPSKFQESRLWWSGPSVIEQDESKWLDSHFQEDQFPEMKRVTTLVARKTEPFAVISKLR